MNRTIKGGDKATTGKQRLSGSLLSVCAALVASLFLLVLNVTSTHGVFEPMRASRSGPPNIVLINTDDMTVNEYEAMGFVRRNTGDKGLTFSRGYVTTPACCPSRVSTLTGRYVHNHRVTTHIGPDSGAVKFRETGGEENTLATWLDAAGYHTVLAGKYLNGYKTRAGAPPGWDRWFAANTPSTTHKISDDGRGKVHIPQDRNDPDYRHWEDAIGDRLVRSIREAPADEPLFLYYASHAPHTPLTWPPRHDGAYGNRKPPRGPAYNEADVSDKPNHIRSSARLKQGQKNLIEKRYPQRLRSIVSVVDQIRRVESELENQGRLGNTIFFFTSDNGFHFGEHRQAYGKLLPYEEDLRVPLAVWGRGVPVDRKRDHLVANIDLAPTIGELAGARVPWNQVDGRDFSSLLAGGTTPKDPLDFRRRIMFEGYDDNEEHGPWNIPPDFHGIRDLGRDFAYVKYASGEAEYYNMKRDPYQLNSLHARLTPQRKERLDTVHRNLKTCSGASCRRADGGTTP